MTKNNDEKSSGTGIERRKTKRRPVIETFSMFVVIPKKGLHRLQIHDLSETGMGFDLDIEGEAPEHFQVKQGEVLDFRFYMNNSLYIPLSIKAVRISQKDGKRAVGAEFQGTDSKNYKVFLSLLKLLDQMAEVAVIEDPS